MKAIKKIILAGIAMIAMASCMNDHDEPYYDEAPFGNNSIGAPNMSISEFKKTYRQQLLSSSPTEITEDIILKGVVVANDESGNIYKQFVINDDNDAIVVSVNDVGMYAVLPKGQMIAISLKGLSIGGYGKLPQIGTPYTNKYNEIAIGRMDAQTFEQHVKLLGTPNLAYNELTPTDLTEDFLTQSSNKDLMPMYARLCNVSFEEADGTALFAPEELVQNSAVERTVKVGKQNVIFRLSNYADFAYQVIPQGKFNIVGVLTRYNNYWQFMLSSDSDITPVEE